MGRSGPQPSCRQAECDAQQRDGHQRPPPEPQGRHDRDQDDDGKLDQVAREAARAVALRHRFGGGVRRLRTAKTRTTASVAAMPHHMPNAETNVTARIANAITENSVFMSVSLPSRVRRSYPFEGRWPPGCTGSGHPACASARGRPWVRNSDVRPLCAPVGVCLRRVIGVFRHGRVILRSRVVDGVVASLLAP